MTDTAGPTFAWPVHPAAELFPLASDDELAELTDDIKANGLIEPVWLYNDPDRGTVLLDGRNRSIACQRAGATPTTRTYHGADPIGFSISQNLKRRHLTTGQKAMLALKVEPLYAAEAAERRERLGREAALRQQAEARERVRADLPQPPRVPAPPISRTPTPSPPEPERIPRARDFAARTAGTSGRAVAQAKRVAEHAPDLANKVESGQIALDRAERIIRDREAEQRRIEQARREAEAQPEPTTVDIRHGDFREVLAGLRNIDAVVTDPPYPAEYLPLLADLAAWADRVLAPDGVLAVLIGQTHLPDVYRLLDGHRPYRWTGCYLTEGAGYVSHPRRIQSNWKPVLLYGAGPRLSDIVRSTGINADAKNNHRWGQDYNAFHTLIERLTQPGQTVADPFAGSGTTLLAAKALGRHAVGCDTDPESVRTAQERVA